MEKILIVGVGEIIKKLLPVLEQHISPLVWGIKDDLTKLKLTLQSIQAAVSIAETNQANDDADRLWLARLKDVVFDADDVIDQYFYELTRRNERRDEKGSHLKHKVQDFVSFSCSNPLLFRFRIARKIRAINKALDEIHKENERYNRPTTSPGVNVVQATEISNLQTSSKGGDDSVLLGRETAKSEIISMMLNNRSSPSIVSSSGNSSRQAKTSVVSIVGMGGLGKTTLAQLIYNDDSNLGNFDSKAWVCVSDNFNIPNILIKMIESIDNETKYGGSSDLEPLGNQVSKRLKGKNFLLVLDDLWNEDAIYWDNLIKLLTGANSISILTTTRNLKVAVVVGGKIHQLQKLSDDVCWSIMKNIVSSRDERVLTLEAMNTIGKDIAKRCDGLPLAAHFLGSIMASNTTEGYWRWEIKDNINLWNTTGNQRLISIIKFSFDKLPPSLKQCFSYCSLFPKDWVIEREMLIRLWIAEGFLQPSNVYDHKSIEDIGNYSFELLWSNSFFQDIKKDELGVIMSCKMHDIVHDLALSVVDVEEYGILQSSASKVCRLQLVCGEGSSSAIPKALSKKLRTIVALAPEEYSQINSLFSIKHLRVLCPLGEWGTEICTSIPKLKHLRYLNLSGCKFDSMNDMSLNRSYNLQTLVLRRCVNVSTLLRKVNSLKSLTYLDLSYSDINILPDSIFGLINLQTLNIHRCYKFEALPENIGLLIHLSSIYLSHTAIRKIPDSITCLSNLRILEFSSCEYLEVLPRDFGSLTQLRCLDVSGTKIKELPESCTRTLCNLEMVNIGVYCKLVGDIRNWPKLKHFTHHSFKDGNDIMPRGVEKLIYLERLESYMVRKEATTQVCSGSSTSRLSGIEELAALNDLQVLYIRNLENVGGKEDAERAKLKDKTNLRELYLHDGDNDMVLEGLRPHPNLTKLLINDFTGLNLPKWMGSSSNCLLPNLVSLILCDCNRCENLPALGMLPCLRDLKIRGMDSVKCLVTESYYQQQEEKEEEGRKGNSTTKRLSLFPSLVWLTISDMGNLEEWIAPSLSYFDVDFFPLLEFVQIRKCQKLRSAPNSLPSLKSLELDDTDDKVVNSMLSASRGGGGCLTSLTSIKIDGSPELVYFPLSLLLKNNVPNLHSLKITRCYKFQGFCDDDLYNNNNIDINTSLHKLELYNCPFLTSLPDLRLWTSLRELTIFKCHKLKEYIPYDLKTSLTFLDSLKVDFIQRENPNIYTGNLIDLLKVDNFLEVDSSESEEQVGDPDYNFSLIDMFCDKLEWKLLETETPKLLQRR